VLDAVVEGLGRGAPVGRSFFAAPARQALDSSGRAAPARGQSPPGTAYAIRRIPPTPRPA